ncbi:MAG: CoB--CoM heterodisulfide reductase iron-sulfur subunit A family protein [Anaerolineales bacterium]
MPDEKIKIGVYTCYCGGNISHVVECEQVAKAMQKQPDVVVSRVNRVVIGACAPSLHEQTFRNTVARAGLNPYLYHHVGLREQDSWVHDSDHDGATSKAMRLMAAGVAKARLLKPLEPIRLEAEKRALVIGGGVAGLRAALDLARQELEVILVEKSPFLGGRMAQLESVFPTGENAHDLLCELVKKVVAHPNITLYTQAEVTGVKGYVGDYGVRISQHSRGVSEENAEALMKNCKTQVPDEFNYGLQQRKVIYRPFKDCYPSTPAVDWEHYKGEPISLNGGKPIVLEDKLETFDVSVGAIVVATGFDPYQPRQGEYGFGELKEVVTLPMLIRHLALNQESEHLVWNGKRIRDIGLIHCVGSREIEGLDEPQADGQVNNYCSRVCCTASLHMIEALQDQYPGLNIYDHGEELDVPVDLVVLAVGMMPRGIDDLVKMLKISRGNDRFLLEVHPKLRPVETAVNGVVLAGTAQGPMNIQESLSAASAAAAKVVSLLGLGKVELQPFVAAVDPEKCTGSGLCLDACLYEGALSLETFEENGTTVKRAIVTPANCSGCGACVGVCPNHAIDVQGWTLAQYEAMVDAITMEAADLMEVA